MDGSSSIFKKHSELRISQMHFTGTVARLEHRTESGWVVSV